jgi:hypothetical protein
VQLGKHLPQHSFSHVLLAVGETAKLLGQ